VTHDAEEFLALADGVMLLHEGRVAFSGTVEDLLAAAGDLESRGLWTPPELVRAQLRVPHRDDPRPPVLDVALAARRLAEGRR
jgi:ABC-type multidrug transport system ATPase subunit